MSEKEALLEKALDRLKETVDLQKDKVEALKRKPKKIGEITPIFFCLEER